MNEFPFQPKLENSSGKAIQSIAKLKYNLMFSSTSEINACVLCFAPIIHIMARSRSLHTGSWYLATDLSGA